MEVVAHSLNIAIESGLVIGSEQDTPTATVQPGQIEICPMPIKLRVNIHFEMDTPVDSRASHSSNPNS